MVYRGRNRPIINSIKHTIDTQNTIGAGTQTRTTMAAATSNPDISASATDVKVGSNIRSIFLNVQVVTATNAVGAINNCYMYIDGNPGSTIPIGSFPLVNDVGRSNVRKMIFHQEMAMLSDENDSIPITLFKGVLKIPKKFVRQGLDDSISVTVGTPIGGPELDACIQCIYKEYS